MEIQIYQVDAFANSLFSGNPAAVCYLESWLPDSIMRQIAAENNLSETAFLVKQKRRYEIRWFTPTVEVDLCGHATLASAFVLFNYYEPNVERIELYSPRSGKLTVQKSKNGLIELNFPSDALMEVSQNEDLSLALGVIPTKVLKGKTDYLLVFDNQSDIESITPDFEALKGIESRGIIVTSKGTTVDFVSRFFGPNVGVNEDPVTGSAHTSLIPYWAKALDKTDLHAQQLSQRGGELFCKFLGDRVTIAGKAVLYLVGKINV